MSKDCTEADTTAGQQNGSKCLSSARASTGLPLSEETSMQRSLQFVVLLCFALSINSAFSQAVAYVYVANNPKSSSTNEIAAWSAASDGKLSAVSGSPFRENVTNMAVNGKYLVAVSRNAPNIDTFAIEPGGVLRYVSSTDYANHTSGDCAAAGQVFFDHTGSDLYVQEFNADCANTGVASFALNRSTGSLGYRGLDNTGAFPGDNNAAWFIGNNLYAYTAVNSNCMYYRTYGFKRTSTGLLVNGGGLSNYPLPSKSFRQYVPELVAADPTSHLAVLVRPADPPGCTTGLPQIAVYTANAAGVISTSSTFTNMPTTFISSPNDMKMSPSGKLLAVAGQQGLQIFHFNGADPVTRDTGLLIAAPINQVFWDNSNHLYAISKAQNKLFVFTITPTFARQAWGSPYTINRPEDLIVQPLVP
jgi:hypothetical protein